MNKSGKRTFLAGACAALLVGFGMAQDGPPAAAAKDSSLYPADFGLAEIDVSNYPEAQREAYKVFAFKCAACHTLARPINSQFLELTKEEAKTADRGLFKDDALVKAEDKIWSRYVKRMMAKPGSPIKGDEGRRIYEFLVFDAKARKTGPNAKAWRAYRGKLVDDFKKKHPAADAKLRELK